MESSESVDPEKPPDDVSPEAEYWAAAVSYLEPAKSIERLASNAKYVITSVTLVAATLTAAGTLTAEQIQRRDVTMWLGTATAITATAAVLFAYLPLVLNKKKIKLENLAEVREWFSTQFWRARCVTIAGILLAISIVLALTVAVIVAVVPSAPEAASGLTIEGSSERKSVTISVDARNLEKNSTLVLSLVGRGRGGEAALLIAAYHNTNSNTVKVERSVDDVQQYSCFILVVDNGTTLSYQELGCR